jgi:hypothetical protein
MPATPERKRILLSGVQELQFTYYNGNNWENNWDSTQQTNLPTGIKVRIQMANQSVDRRTMPGKVYELYVPVDVQLSTNLITTATP